MNLKIITAKISLVFIFGEKYCKYNKITEARAILNELKPEDIPTYFNNNQYRINLHANASQNIFYLQAYFTLFDFISRCLAAPDSITLRVCYGRGSHSRFHR